MNTQLRQLQKINRIKQTITTFQKNNFLTVAMEIITLQALSFCPAPCWPDTQPKLKISLTLTLWF